MQKVIPTALTAISALALFAAAPAVGASAHGTLHVIAAKDSVQTSKVTATRAALRDLWLGHVFWVRNVVVGTLGKNAAEAKAAENQVVDNAKAIAAAIEPYYGAKAKDALFDLLAKHYGAVKSYLTASVAKNSAGENAAIQALNSNAEQIAALLSGANPNLPKEAVLGLLQAHGAHHIAQIQQLSAGKFDAEAATWNDMKDHMYVVADALADAIAKQFPNKFASVTIAPK
ncbi:MAG TPA: hypothetical protein VFK79_10515 [Xanthobacteraceae bacterium]|nr:hypothetical protein [Xanthobacteraceae bacterium]